MNARGHAVLLCVGGTMAELSAESQGRLRPAAPETSSKRPKILGVTIHGTYGTASTIAGIFEFFGWTLVVVGAVVGLSGLAGSAPYVIVALGIGIGIAAMGLLQVGAAQMLRALVDSADYARQALLLQIALAEGRTEIDLRRPLDSQRQGELPLAGPKTALAQGASDLSKGLSNEALSVLRKAKDRGYEVHLSPDKGSVVLSHEEWRASFSSEAEIIKFGQGFRQ